MSLLLSRPVRALVAAVVGVSGLAVATPAVSSAAPAAGATGVVGAVRYTSAVIESVCDTAGNLTSTTVTAQYDAATARFSVPVTIIHNVLRSTFPVYETQGTYSGSTTAGGHGSISRTITLGSSAPDASVTDEFTLGTRVGLQGGGFFEAPSLTISAPHQCGTTRQLADPPTVTVSAPACDGSVAVTVDASASDLAWTPRAQVGNSLSRPVLPTVAAHTVSTVHVDLGNKPSDTLIVALGTTSPLTGDKHELVDGGTYSLTTPAPAACVAVNRGAIVPVMATRLVDTRAGTGAPRAALASLGRLSVQASGLAGIPAGATAAAVNITTTAPQAAGYLQAWASATAPGTTSVLNFTAGQTISRSAIVPLDPNGRFLVRNVSGGSAQVVVDVTGYALGTGTPAAADLVPMDPTRLLDTRATGTFVPVKSGETYRVQVSGRAGIAEASAVALQVTAVGGSTTGYLTAWSGEGTMPRTSSVNYLKGQVVGGLSTVAVAANGTVAVTNTSPGTVHLLVDVEGYWRAGTAATTGSVVALPPQRLLDTRTSGGALGAGASRDLDVVNATGPAGHLHGVAAILVNLTTTGATAPGYLQASALATVPGTASVLNYDRGAISSNLALVPVGDVGQITVTNRSAGSTHVIVDVVGYVSR